jgi:hypothetical protein
MFTVGIFKKVYVIDMKTYAVATSLSPGGMPDGMAWAITRNA